MLNNILIYILLHTWVSICIFDVSKNQRSMEKSQQELEKMSYAELSDFRSQITKNTKSRFEIAQTLPYPKSLNDLSYQEIQSMTKEEKERFKSEYQNRKQEIVKKREEEYQKQFIKTSIDWIDSRLSALYDELPNEIKYKEVLDYLREAKASAISISHKKMIDYYISEIINGKDVANIIRYELPAIWYMGAKQFVSTLIKKLGGKRYHKSEKTVRGSVYYKLPNHKSIRISDHELPDTELRQYNNSIGIGGSWIEIVLSHPKKFSELKIEVLKLIDEQIGEAEQIKADIKEMLSDTIYCSFEAQPSLVVG